MKLIRLSSSIKTFKTVNFNPRGFTIILAENKDEQIKTKSSFNGVGKSFIVYLIHFCLGCQDNKDLKNKIPDEYFELEFSVNEKLFKTRRYTSEQEFIYLNNEKFKIKQFLEKVQEWIFPESSFKYITFKQLISRFIRPFTYSYSSWTKWLPKEDKNDHVPNLNTLHLFGFDSERILRKFELKEKLKDYENKLKSFKKDPILQEYFKDTNRDLSIDIENLKETITNKQNKLNSLNFSNDYYEIESKTEKISIIIRKINNKIILLENALLNIDNSLKNDFGKDSEFVSNVYEMLKQSMKEGSMKELKEVIDFHNLLLDNRQKRLKEEKKRVFGEIEGLKIKYKKLTNEHNSYLELLNKNAPFEQGLAIKEDINNLTQKLLRLQQYDEIIEKYKSKISDKKLEIEQDNKSTDDYLKDIKELRINIDNKFKELINLFYDSKESYISIKNNVGNNSIRFDLNVKVEDDSSNGVREIEIFCFDLVLFILKKNALVNFLFHDSRLFANVDPSQMVIAFGILVDLIKKKDMQYIISLNKTQYNEIHEEFKLIKKEEEFNKIFNKNTIKLVLTKNDEGKLLGFQRDINYDKT